jgi:5-hydroxyisourate hydrolase
MAARLTTHVLDTAHGCPAADMTVSLYRVSDGVLLVEARTNADGRVDQPLLQGEAWAAGSYELTFRVGDYYRARGVVLPDPAFLDVVVLRFGMAEASHYHVPLLVSPYSYSTYRGS